MLDSGLFDGFLHDGAASFTRIFFTAELGAILISPDTDPWMIDPDQTAELSPDTDPWMIDPDQTDLYWF